MKISHSSLFLAIRFNFSIMFNGVNFQRGKFILVYVIYIAIEIIMIISSIIGILEFLLSYSLISECHLCFDFIDVGFDFPVGLMPFTIRPVDP